MIFYPILELGRLAVRAATLSITHSKDNIYQAIIDLQQYTVYTDLMSSLHKKYCSPPNNSVSFLIYNAV